MNSRRNRDFGSVLLGSAAESAVRQRVRIQTLLTASIVVANLFGAIVAVALTAVGIPQPTIFTAELWWVNFIVVPVYITAAFVVGIGWGTYVGVRDLRWAIRDVAPTKRDARRTMRLPWRLSLVQGFLWGIAAITFSLDGLREALLESGRVGIARVVISTRQHLAVLEGVRRLAGAGPPRARD